uniref:Phage protein n=1 Tax=Caenorhabditis tropicalis TaxID=1561998 RepID=A0A1I7TH90_9PELO
MSAHAQNSQVYMKDRVVLCHIIAELGNRDVVNNQEAGCVFNATCIPNTTGMMLFVLWSGSQIEMPADVDYDGGPIFYLRAPSTGDVMNNFGIICENGTWYATKYPQGISYWALDGDITRNVGTPEEYNGRKTPVSGAYCFVE